MKSSPQQKLVKQARVHHFKKVQGNELPQKHLYHLQSCVLVGQVCKKAAKLLTSESEVAMYVIIL